MNDIKKIKKSHTYQIDSSDCGVASLLSVIKYYGGDETISKLRELSGTTIKGTTLLGLYQAAENVGFKAKGCNCGIDDLVEHGKPVILHIINGNLQHYIVCYGFNGDKFIISDPSLGIVYYSKDELLRIWQTRNCLILSPTYAFKLRKDIAEKKKKWLLGIISQDKPILIISAVIGVFISVLGMVMAIFSQKLIDDILPNRDVNKLLIGIVLVSLLLIFRVVLDAIRMKLLLKQGMNFNNRVIDFFYGKLLFMPMSFFDNRKKGDMIARLNDTRRIQNTIVGIVGSSVIDVITVVVCAITLFAYSKIISVIVVLFSLMLFTIIFKYNKPIVKRQQDVMTGYSLTESNFISTISGILVIKGFGKQSLYRKLNHVLYSVFQRRIYDLGSLKIKISVFSGLLSVVVVVIAISVCSFQIISGDMTTGELMAIVGITSTLLPAVSGLALLVIPINEATVAFDRMFEITNDTCIVCDEEGSNVKIAAETINIKDLCFRFSGNKLLLSNINMKFEKGKVVAITGECGCGKSTLISLLQRFYQYEKGSIDIDNINIRSISTDEWMGITSVIPQDVYIFNGTVLSNIMMDDDVSRASDVIQFCNDLGFDKFINKLPLGYLTIVGEEGVNLSGGQKQLLAIARALYKRSPVLILDEPTASMDSETEMFVFNLLKNIKKDKIIICVSHKLDCLKLFSDYIYVIEQNSVSAHGVHAELFNMNNFYGKYWKRILC